MSTIAIRGFISGYMEKMAQDPLDRPIDPYGPFRNEPIGGFRRSHPPVSGFDALREMLAAGQPKRQALPTEMPAGRSRLLDPNTPVNLQLERVPVPEVPGQAETLAEISRRPEVPVDISQHRQLKMTPFTAGGSPTTSGQAVTWKEPQTPAPGSRWNIADFLKKWGGPAALGAAAVGGGSLLWDYMNRKNREAEGKPGISIKKALLLSLVLGIPLGLATKYLSSPQGRMQLASLFNRGEPVSA